MSNEREEFEKWSAEELPASYVKKHRTVLREVWQACAERKQREIDALAALVERKDEALRLLYDSFVDSVEGGSEDEVMKIAQKALSLTAPDALRERDARKAAEVLREAAELFGAGIDDDLRELAAAKERGE